MLKDGNGRRMGRPGRIEAGGDYYLLSYDGEGIVVAPRSGWMILDMSGVFNKLDAVKCNTVQSFTL